MTEPDMSPQAVERRLESVAELSTLSLQPIPRVSMAPADVEARICECSEMSGVCLALARDAVEARARSASSE